MVPDADRVLADVLARDEHARGAWTRDRKLREDPRITPVGAWLRRTSLDELPQLWNVLRGDMSLVGPRPVIAEELARYGEAVRYYLDVRPGITGLWQISGRSDTDYAERVALDAWYIKNWSLWYDVVILVKTLRVVGEGRGAY
jgi:undecaprenyl-phosphate galactose phosphotransferase